MEHFQSEIWMPELKVSVIIKALNEEQKIRNCIESCISALEGINSEIILVDSLSTDNTVAIASEYPIKIVQFQNQTDVCCGAAPQLGYQHAVGQYIYILDGDMTFSQGFLNHAIDYLDNNSDVAGVAGKLIDTQFSSSEDKRRSQEYTSMKAAQKVTHLGGGGLYRKESIESVGYFSHSGLKAREEFELGARITSKGWKLMRLPIDGVLHTGHSENDFERLRRLWHNGRLASNAVLIKSAFMTPWFFKSLKHLWYLFVPFIVSVLFLVNLLIVNFYHSFTLLENTAGFILLWLLFISLLAAKKKSFYQAFNTLLTSSLGFLALILALGEEYQKPQTEIKNKVIKGT